MTPHQATVDVSSESSSASGGPGLLNHDSVRGWMSGADVLMAGDPRWGCSGTVQDFITLVKMACNLKL